VSKQIPLVDYLVLADKPHLVAWECDTCAARYFGRRSGCASCSGTDFTTVPIDTQGSLVTYTIVSHAAPGIPVPFVAGVVDCSGTSVRANVVNVEPTPEHISLGMPLRLTTYPVGADDEGTEAIAFGFEPEEIHRTNGGD
jgi:uncharacterized OB-fold protein